MTKLECVNGDAGKCPQGELLRIRGEHLQRAEAVMFLGRRGREDDKVASTDKRSPHRVVVRVPPDAATGPVRIKSSDGLSRPSRRLRVTTPADPPLQLPAPAPGEGVFPVRGTYDFGTEINRFGGGRGHKGQDVFAACGTPIVSARSGTVTFAKFHDRAGNYAVITADDGTSQAYMHMLAPATVQRPQRVIAGQPIGQVGQTGRTSGCHLHFELWTAPGWYRGGQAVDPLPELQRYAAGAASPT
ncbi:MAG: M23 family metallopeptidase [Solirubrobacterales bacterium]|nr:M23 family metallopeptidase [Solirubrobacterales bacterium]